MYKFRSKEIIIRDTEYTSWEGSMERSRTGENEYKEIVQIGAIKVNTETREEIDHFNKFVLPKLNPILSDYFKNLTGISQDDVNSADHFDIVVDEFKNRTYGLQCFSYGGDEIILAEECGLYRHPYTFNNIFSDARDIFRALGLPAEKYTSGRSHEMLGLPATQIEHNALGDARNILYTIKKIYKIQSKN